MHDITLALHVGRAVAHGHLHKNSSAGLHDNVIKGDLGAVVLQRIAHRLESSAVHVGLVIDRGNRSDALGHALRDNLTHFRHGLYVRLVFTGFHSPRSFGGRRRRNDPRGFHDIAAHDAAVEPQASHVHAKFRSHLRGERR